MLTIFLFCAILVSLSAPVVQGMSIVKVDVISKGSGPPVTRDDRYSSMVTLYIEDDNGEKKKSGWSTEYGTVLNTLHEYDCDYLSKIHDLCLTPHFFLV